MDREPLTTQAAKLETADLQPLLQRFDDALAVVIAGLAPLTAAAGKEASVTTPASGGRVALPRAGELADLLAHNDTRAESVMAELRAGWNGPEPAWLSAIAKAIDSLDYQGALKSLRDSGAIGADGSASTG